MELIAYFREAVTNLLSAKLRSFLAILGVLVGTGSVVALISSSQLATEHALQQFKTLGTNLLAVYIHDSGVSRQSTAADTQALTLADIPAIQHASSEIMLAAPYTIDFKETYFNAKNLEGQVIGVTDAFINIAKLQLSRGRFISNLDQRHFFCVVGAKIAEKIRAMGADPLWNQIRVGPNMFTIVGILKPWPENYLVISADLNRSVIVTIPTAQTINPKIHIDNILLRLIHSPNIPLVKQQVTAVLNTVLPKKQLSLHSPEQIIHVIAKQKQTYTWLLAAIGSISLIVGGIGVMNIMLVSVVERRREIGIRMAIGARQFDILRMFLIESVMLTVFGGLLGVVVGVFTSYALSIFSHWQFYFYGTPVILGFVVSVLVGIFSGFYPAWCASKLDPIQTLVS